MEISNRKNMMAMGSNDSFANLKITKVIPQNTMASVTLSITPNRFKSGSLQPFQIGLLQLLFGVL